MITENEKMEHEYTHQFEQYLQEQHSKKHVCVNDVKNDLSDDKHDVNDNISERVRRCFDGWNIVKDLLNQGKSVVTSHPDIENNHLFVIESNHKAFLIQNKGKENVRLRELTEAEYKIADTIYA